MTTVLKYTPPPRFEMTEEVVPLKDVGVGEMFRFYRQGGSLDDALKSEAELDGGLWRVIRSQPAESGRVTILSRDCQIQRKVDDVHLVIKHDVTEMIHDAKLVQVKPQA